jgi:hypothetical protein
MHLAIAESILFLILPRRCLQSSFFQTSGDFLRVLKEVFGLALWEPPHLTPKVAFFVLKKPNITSCTSTTDLDWISAIRQRIEHSISNHSASISKHQALYRKVLLSDTNEHIIQEKKSHDTLVAEPFSLTVPPELLSSSVRASLKTLLSSPS